MHPGFFHRPSKRIPFSGTALLLTTILLSGTCELDPPTTPSLEWEFSGEGRLSINDGPNGRMTRLRLSFATITAPPNGAAYAVFIFTATDSVAIGDLMPAAGSTQAQLTWDETERKPIFGRYLQSRINVVGGANLATSRRSFSFWWSSVRAAKLHALFAESGAAFQLIDLANQLVELGVGITTAATIDVAREKAARMNGQLEQWRSELAVVRAASAALANGSPQFSSMLTEIEQRSAASLLHADTLANLLSPLTQAGGDSVANYHLIGFKSYLQADAIKDQAAPIYPLCQRFAALEVVIGPSANRTPKRHPYVSESR